MVLQINTLQLRHGNEVNSSLTEECDSLIHSVKQHFHKQPGLFLGFPSTSAQVSSPVVLETSKWELGDETICQTLTQN